MPFLILDFIDNIADHNYSDSHILYQQSDKKLFIWTPNDMYLFGAGDELLCFAYIRDSKT